MFSKVASFSGSLAGDVSAAKAAEINAATDLIRVYVGNVTDPSYNETVNMVEKFDTAGVEYEFDGVNPATGGIWESWQVNLRDFASRLFRPVEDHGPSEGHLALDGPHSLPAPGTNPTPWIDENNIVTFETGTQYADATNITIWANWAPAGGWLRIPMEKQADGRWRLTVGPLEGGSYYYVRRGPRRPQGRFQSDDSHLRTPPGARSMCQVTTSEVDTRATCPPISAAR